MRSPTSASFARAVAPGMTLAQAAQRAIQLGGIYDGHEAARRRQQDTPRHPLQRWPDKV